MNNFDVAIIGAGPGGYTAAVLAAQKNLKTLLIEKDNLGGVCLNAGCIPTKFILYASNLIYSINTGSNFGIKALDLKLNYDELKINKDKEVSQLRKGIGFLLQKRGVIVKEAQGKIISPNEVLLEKNGNKEKISAKYIIVAAGSSPLSLSNIEFDYNNIHSSSSILNIDSLPKSLIIVGAGVIGVELAMHFARVGTKVELIELKERILPNEDEEVSSVLERVLRKMQIGIHTKSEVIAFKKEAKFFNIDIDSGLRLRSEKMLIAVSRKANLDSITMLKNIAVENGFLKVNARMQTSIQNIYAIGDIKGGFMLAHSASYEAKIAIANILGEDRVADYTAMPVCVYTDPEIARVGLFEEEAKSSGFDIAIAKFPFASLGKAKAVSKQNGFVKLIADRKNKIILGVHIIGPCATEYITEMCMAVKFKIPYTALLDIIHPHPTFSEALQEAIEILNNQPIHTL